MSAIILLKMLLTRGRDESVTNLFKSLASGRRLHKIQTKHSKATIKSNSSSLDAKKFSEICRFCQNEIKTRSFSVFDASDALNVKTNIAQIIANVRVEADDGLPQQFCGRCSKLLDQVLSFKRKCRKTDRELRIILCTKAEGIELSDYDQSLDDDFGIDIKEELYEFNFEEMKIDDENIEAFLDAENDSTPCGNNLLEYNFDKLKSKVAFRQFDDLFCEKCQIKFECDADFTKHSLSEEHLSKGWCCSDCKKEFNRRADYEVHRRVHTGERPYMCELCGRGFSYNTSFRNHMLVHKKLFPFKCKSCPHRARNTWAIKVHERTHTGERPHVCPHCPATFTTTSNCKRHVMKHLDSQPFKCEQCKKSFNSKQYLHDHKRTVHDNIKLYKCSQCGIMMGFKRSLRKHELRVHKIKKKRVLQ